jgi:hypothetical protein
MLIVDGAARAFQPTHRRIAVEAEHQPVALAARRVQKADMAGMQDVEAAIGEADA